MRWLYSIAGLWLAVIVGVVVLLMLRGDPQANLPPPPPLTCDSLQSRFRECKQRVSDSVGAFAQRVLEGRGDSQPAAAAKRLVVQGFVSSAIDDGKVKRYCARFRDSKVPLIRRLRGELERCWKNRGCKAFVACLVRVAEAERKAGRLPL